ncbi:MAG: fasciclin domain-containing protein [Prevotella sp.]|nr:fasciclin domain-containing protein [Prevotella sp.]
MKTNKYIGITMLAATMLTAASCTDFDDYNEVPSSDPSNGASLTLWENISQKPELSNFMELIKRTGFEQKLMEPRSFTIWAPVNSNLNLDDYKNLSDSLLLAQVINNHIAEFNYVASGDVNTNVFVRNKKRYQFVGNGTYTFGDVKVLDTNIPGTNGTLHLLDSVLPFRPSIYEYLRLGTGFDKIRDYIINCETRTLDISKSEKGPMVNGVQTYVDSVITVSNYMLDKNHIKASLSNEDSSYVFVAPTDEAYTDMYDKIKKIYKYATKTVSDDITKYDSKSADSTVSITINNTELLADSITKQYIAYNLFFSNNDTYNKGILDKKFALDTLRATTKTKLSNPQELLTDHLVGEPKLMSNGYVYMVDSLAYRPEEVYNPELEIFPVSATMKCFDHDENTIQVTDSSMTILGPDYLNFKYKIIQPSGGEESKKLPTVFIKLPGVRATKYKFYCVFLPLSVGGSVNQNPSPFNYKLHYCKADGTQATYAFSAKYNRTGKSTDRNPSKLDLNNTSFMNDPEKTDTMYLGEFEFPICYSGLSTKSSEFCPMLEITSPINVLLKTQLQNNSRDLRIWSFILKPQDE